MVEAKNTGNMNEDRLPDTLTPVEGGHTSQGDLLPIPWGRLVTCKAFMQSVDLVDCDFIFGRSDDCTIMVTTQHCPNNFLFSISKKHFAIQRNVEDNLVYITDLSKNGTFINNEKLGKGKKKILKSDDKIAVANPATVLYIFICIGSEGIDNFLPDKLSAKYAYIRKLGRGSCGEVGLVRDRDDFNLYAVKKIIKGNSKSQIHKMNHPIKIDNEINILKSLSHPCIIGMKDIQEIQNEVYIVLEYMAGGELTNQIRSVESDLSENQAKFYFYQMVLAVQYLHLNRITHRDLKPENILLLDDRKETVLKITDFGLSKITNDNDMTTMCGTYTYVAPEVIIKAFRDYGEYGKEVDVWSLGVILFFMLSKELPFSSDDVAILRRQISTCSYSMTGERWRTISPEAKNLIKRMLVLMPKNRIKIEEILQHPWIKNDYGVKYRVEMLLRQEGFENPLEYLVLEPPEKKFKFNDNIFSSSSSSAGSESTLLCSNGFSVNTTMMC